MKKSTLLLLILFFASFEIFSQATLFAGAPLFNSYASNRVPNGLASHGYVRSAHHILASDLTGIPTTGGTVTLTAIGFSATTGPANPYSGNIRIYLKNTTDPNYQLGTTWPGIISSMTLVYQGPISVPLGSNQFDVTLQTPHTYTNTQHLYVAYDFTLTSKPSSTTAVLAANSSIPGSGVTVNTVNTVYYGAPANNVSTNTVVPNSQFSHRYVRSATHILASELTSIPTTTNGTAALASVGFSTTSGASAAMTGSIDIYLGNTSDATYSLGTTWSSIVSGLTPVYSGTISMIANTAGVHDFILPTPFTYTNTENLYVAYSYSQTTGFAGIAANFAANNTMTAACAALNNSSASPATLNMQNIRPYFRFGTSTTAPSTLTTNSIRPHFRFGYANPYTNDLAVTYVWSAGKLPVLFGGDHKVKAIVRNASNDTVKNITVNLNIFGFNGHNDTYTIAALPSGVNDTITFQAPFTPTAQGINTVQVSVPNDQNNTNNSRTWKMEANCATYGIGASPFPFSGLSVGFNTASGLILNKFRTSVANATVSGCNIAIGNDAASAGNSIYTVLLDSLGAILSTSNVNTITTSQFNKVVSFSLSPVTLTQSKGYWIGLAQPSNTTTGYFPLGTQLPAAWIPKDTYAVSNLTGGFISPLTNNLGILGIEAVFQTTCVVTLPVVENPAAQLMELSIFPNPASDNITVALSNLSPHAYVEIFNTIGQLVMRKENLEEETRLNTSSLSKGIYIVKVTNGKQVATGKLVIDK